MTVSKNQICSPEGAGGVEAGAAESLTWLHRALEWEAVLAGLRRAAGVLPATGPAEAQEPSAASAA